MNRIEELQKIISEANAELNQIREECSHPTPCLTKKCRSNTGNYAPSDDCYWIDWSCSLCGKRWMTDQDFENINKPAGKTL